MTEKTNLVAALCGRWSCAFAGQFLSSTALNFSQFLGKAHTKYLTIYVMCLW